MVEEYKLVETLVEKKLVNDDDKEVIVPIGARAYVVDKFKNGWCIIEFTDNDVGYPIVADYREDELEMVKED